MNAERPAKSGLRFCAPRTRIVHRWARSAPRSRSTSPAGGVRRAVRPQPQAVLHRPLHIRPAPDEDRPGRHRRRRPLPVRDAPPHLWMDTVITEVEEPQRIVEHGHGGRANRIPSTTVWELLEGPGSLVTARVSSGPSPRAMSTGRSTRSGWPRSGSSAAGARRCTGSATISRPRRRRRRPDRGRRRQPHATGIP